MTVDGVGSPTHAMRAEVILVSTGSGASDAARFLLLRRSGRLACPDVPLGRPGDRLGLPDLVTAAVKRKWKVDADYVGAVDFVDDADAPTLVAVLAVGTVPSNCSLEQVPLSDIRTRDQELPFERFERAAHWCEARKAAAHLHREIGQSTQRATNLLRRTLAEEEGHKGWQQYFRKDSVGSLSTANGVLACVYAGGPEAWQLVQAPLTSLRAFQDAAGGWSVRRSLIGSQSDKLVTESTCHCLLAFLEAGRRSTDDENVRRGLDWLVAQQHEDGGWSSTKPDHPSQVYATALAVRVLGLYQQKEPAKKGVEWLLSTQGEDGGWGAIGDGGNGPVSSSPAYAGAAVSALIAAGTEPGDPAIRQACEYLRRTFDPDRPEPWEATSFITTVDSEKHADLEFRHFATAYALAALCEAGHNLSDPVVLTATRRLLDLQLNTGEFTCALTAPANKTIWAVCNALYALRKTLDSSGGDLAPLALDTYRGIDRDTMAKLAGNRLTATLPVRGKSRRDWFMLFWLSALTAGLFALVMFLFLQSGTGDMKASGMGKFGLTALSFIGAIITAATPSIVTEALKRRNNRHRNDGS
jgi:hypothetical protein